MTDKELRELAEKATPGPWYSQYGEENTPAEEPPQWNGEMYITGIPGTAQYDQSSYVATVGYNGSGEADAAYIAAANPSRIIELLDRVEKLENMVDKACSFLTKCHDCDECHRKYDCAEIGCMEAHRKYLEEAE